MDGSDPTPLRACPTPRTASSSLLAAPHRVNTPAEMAKCTARGTSKSYVRARLPKALLWPDTDSISATFQTTHESRNVPKLKALRRRGSLENMLKRWRLG